MTAEEPDTQLAALSEVLAEEARTCMELAAVLGEEQAAMVALRPEAIAACLERRRDIEAVLARLAERRRTAILEAACAAGASVGTATELLPHLAPELRAHLAHRIRDLRSALLTVRALERQNALLASSSLESVGELLGVLQSHHPGARYRADARVETGATVERVDRRV